MFRLALITLLALFAWCFWPAMSAHFVIDDYVFLAQSRMVDAPWAAFVSNHFYEPYYFRPIGVVVWWIATRVFELSYPAHSAINLLLHALNVALLAVLVRTLTDRTSAALAAAALFAFLPFSYAATLWPSNRFDLLAVLFLLVTAIAGTSYFRSGKPLAWLVAGAAALGACLSKELAFPIATLMALLALVIAPSAPWQRRAALFVLLGASITLAFIWRHAMLPMPYAAASTDVVATLWRGGSAWASAAPRLFSDAVGRDSLAQFALYGIVAVTAFALLSAVIAQLKSRRERPLVSWSIIGGAVLIFGVSALSQWPLAANFAPMLDGGSLGVVTYARFYYAPLAALAISVGLLLSRARLVRSLATIVVLCAIGIGLQARQTADRFARWTTDTIETVARAATKVVDEVSPSLANAQTGCVIVLLGTQSNNGPWFRMFSDVAVKALSKRPESSWRCQVLTESTPWIFVSPEMQPLADIGLKSIAIDARGTPKPDYTWGGVRYRYRAMVEDAAALPSARFFEWNGTTFVDVTSAVQTGARHIKTHGWGF